MKKDMRVCENCENYSIKVYSEIIKYWSSYSVVYKKFVKLKKDLQCCSLTEKYVDDFKMLVPNGCEYKLEHEVLK